MSQLFFCLQLLLFLKGFSESERNKLAMLTGILLANGTLNASILNSLYNENLVKEGKCCWLFCKRYDYVDRMPSFTVRSWKP